MTDAPELERDEMDTDAGKWITASELGLQSKKAGENFINRANAKLDPAGINFLTNLYLGNVKTLISSSNLWLKI